jgi:rSAM/selenodomain-associated transferase 2
MLSVIIPTLNEEQCIIRTIDVINANCSGLVQEIIVVDGGSTDETLEKLKQRDVVVLNSKKKCRSFQLNLGAKDAKGSILYFLHADTFPPVGFDSTIVKAVKQGYYSGAFQMRFNKKSKLLDLYSYFTRYNWKVCGGGDRSLFVLKEAFDIIEGFPAVQLMEDYELVAKLKKYIDFIVLPQKVITSARSFEKYGVVKLQLIYGVIHLLHSLGMKNKKLYKIYLKMLS